MKSKKISPFGTSTLILAFAISSSACSNNPTRGDEINTSNTGNTSTTPSESPRNTKFDRVMARTSEAITWAYEEPEEPTRCVFPEDGLVDKLNGPLVLTGGTIAFTASALLCISVLGPNSFICRPFAMSVGGIFGLGLTNKGLKALTCPISAITTYENNGLTEIQP